MVIIIGGMIGIGKTTTAKMLHEELGLPVYYEDVKDNKVLPFFYMASPEDQEKYRYPFLLQLNFLQSRYHAIKKALLEDNAIMDRSIYEDHYFARKNHERGGISDVEMALYEDLLSEMMAEISSFPKKAPDLMIYLHGSFETVVKRIQQRGRSFELDQSLVDYYRFLWQNYDDWVHRSYQASPILEVDIEKRNVIYNAQDKRWLLDEIHAFESKMSAKPL